MQGILTQNEIDELLYAETVGHLGGNLDGRTYVLPINYAYDGEYIYGTTLGGTKLQILRTNSEVCFQVDQILNSANWKSVLIWGKYEELEGEESAQALRVIMRHMTMQIASGNGLHEIKGKPHRGDGGAFPKIVVYRVHVDDVSGRFEKQDPEPFSQLTIERYPVS